jgi:hypothetical protein
MSTDLFENNDYDYDYEEENPENERENPENERENPENPENERENPDFVKFGNVKFGKWQNIYDVTTNRNIFIFIYSDNTDEQYGHVQYGHVQYGHVQYGHVQYGLVQYGLVQYGNMQLDQIIERPCMILKNPNGELYTITDEVYDMYLLNR